VPAIGVVRFLVIAEVILLGASILVEEFASESTPAIDEYLEGPGAGPIWRLLETDSMAIELSLFATLVLFLGAYVASLIGVYLLKPWGRSLYVATFAIGVVSYPLFGASLVGPLGATISYLTGVCSGAILAMLFWSDARTSFGARPSAS
jgi:hypothetical protein